MILDHKHPDCTGLWCGEAEGDYRFWRCTRCGVLYPDTQDVREVVGRENHLGWLLQTLTAGGTPG